MKYQKTVILKDGRTCCLRNATEKDAEAALAAFVLTHAQTDFLLSYVDELKTTVSEEGEMLRDAEESPRRAEILAEVDGRIAGLAGLHPLGEKEKTRHRAELGISIDRAFWGRGVGRALLDSLICLGKSAGYRQLELSVISDNGRAIELYRKAGFTEFGRNPRGFLLRTGVFQELILMRLELDD